MSGSCCPTPKGDLYLAKVVDAFPTDDCLSGEKQALYSEPFFDETLPNKFIIIPSVGEDFIIETASASRFSEGQWVYIEGVGRFAISSILAPTRMVIRNTGLDKALEPGKQYAGVRKIWLTEPLSQNSDDYATELLKQGLNNENNELQAFVLESKETENGLPLAGLVVSAACDPCGTKEKTGGMIRVFKVFKNIVFKFLTIGLPKIPKTEASTAVYKTGGEEVENPLLPVMWHPQAGDFYAKTMPSRNGSSFSGPDGEQFALVPTDYADKLYVLSPSQEDGKPEFRDISEHLDVTKLIDQPLVNGSVNIKTIIEGALGITLEPSGQVIVSIYVLLVGPNDSAVFDGFTMVSTGPQDTAVGAYKSFPIDLSAPTVTIGASGSFRLDTVTLNLLKLL